MKNSKFNNYIELHKDYNLLYNSMSDTFLLHKISNSMIKNIEFAEKNFVQVYQKMVDGGFVIANDVDEDESLLNLKRANDEDTSTYMLIVNPTVNCNFKCWYCYETHVADSNVTLETLNRIKKLISIIADNAEIKRFELSFFGGEPLLYYKSTVLPLMKFAHEICQLKDVYLSVTFTTNGYLLKESMIQDLTLYGTTSLQITLDGCKEAHNQIRFTSDGIGSFDKIIQNVKMLITNKIYVRLRVNYTNENLEKSVLIANEFKDVDSEYMQFLVVNFHKVWQVDNVEDATNTIDDICTKFQGLKIRADKQLMDNVRYPCYADKRNEAVINYNGDVYKCTARDFETKNRYGYLSESGDIVWEKSITNRMLAKHRNRLCTLCTIAPLCYGVCSQKAVEAQCDYCLYPKDKDKINVILERFSDYISRHEIPILSSN